VAAAGITVTFDMPYRGHTEEWSQQYHFHGDAPEDSAGWHALADALAVQLKTCIGPQERIVRYYGYEDTDDDAVWSEDLVSDGDPVIGTYTYSGDVAPGDVAAWCRWKTSRVNSNGKAIYLRKYFHGCDLAPSADGEDLLESDYHDALSDFAGWVADGHDAWPGLAGPNGDETFIGSGSSTYSTTRTLKRRGRRP
jgi:hypothetical protein